MQIVIVVVLYKRSPAQSQTITSLAAVFKQNPELLEFFRVFVWDNSPLEIAAGTIPFPYEYGHTGRNLGTSGAYNHAMEFAQSNGAPWMLLLDQDTIIANEFLPQMRAYGERLEGHAEVGAVVGFIYSHGVLVSPRRLRRFNRVQQILPTFQGIHKKKAYAVNSATLLRVSALREIGGYSDDFWLDLSDVYVFQAMHQRGLYMYVAADVHVEHSISSMDFDKEMSPERYRNFMAAESAFVDLYSSQFEQIAQLYRLFVRTIRQYLRYRNKAFAKISWEYFCRRLTQSKANRIAEWRKQLNLRDIPFVEDGAAVG